jgi:hypothetical protein
MRLHILPLAAALSSVLMLAGHDGGSVLRESERNSICPSVSLTPIEKRSLKCGVGCGRDRWQVKTPSDVDQGRVDFRHPVAATVESLAALPRPRYRPQYRRLAPTETTVFCIEGWLADIPRTESDRDMHIVVAGLENPRVTLVAEIPDSKCYGACGSGFGHLPCRRAEDHYGEALMWISGTEVEEHHTGAGDMNLSDRPLDGARRSGAAGGSGVWIIRERRPLRG